MVPFATPYKAVLLKNINNALGYAVFVFNIITLIGTMAGPLPIVGVIGIDIYRHPKTVHAVPVSAFNIAP